MRRFLPDACVCVFLVVLVVGAFYPTAENLFVYYDDPGYVLHQPQVHAGLTAESIRWAFTNGECANWHPLTWLSHQLDAVLFGVTQETAGKHHLMSVGLHAVAGVLLYLVFRAMTGRFWPSALVAVVWAVHPLAVESVAWASERKNVLSAVFWFGTMGAYVWYVRRPGLLRYLAVAAVFALALLSKPTVVTLPCALLLLDFWPLGRVRWLRSSAAADEKLEQAAADEGNTVAEPAAVVEHSAAAEQPAAAVEHSAAAEQPASAVGNAAAVQQAAAVVEHSAAAEQPASVVEHSAAAEQPAAAVGQGAEQEQAVDRIDPAGRIAWYRQPVVWLVVEKMPLMAMTVAASVVTFLVQNHAGALPKLDGLSLTARVKNALVTHVLYLDKLLWPNDLGVFYPHRGDGIGWSEAGAAAAFLLLITAVALACWRRYPFLIVGWLWYLGVMFPMNGLVQAGAHSMVDRHMYLPMVGILFAIAWAGVVALERWPRPRLAVATAVGLAITALTALTWRQTHFWRDDVALWGRCVEVTVNNAMAEGALGSSLSGRGRTKEGLEHLLNALKLNPYDAGNNYNAASCYRDLGETEKAVEYFELALRYGQDKQEQVANVHWDLGRLLNQRGKIEEAVSHYLQAAEKRPDSFLVHFNLAFAMADLGRKQEAADHYRVALENYPDYAEAHNNLGIILEEQANLAEAEHHFREALRIKPDYVEAHSNLGIVLTRLDRFDEADEHFGIALAHHPEYAEALTNRGQLYVRCGRWADALAQYEAALALSPDNVPLHYNLGTLLLKQGQTREAIEHLRTALRLAPGWPPAASKLAWLLATHHDESVRSGWDAVVLARLACKETNYREPRLLDVLAAAYAEEGRYAQALETIDAAIELAEQAELAELAETFRQRRELYRQQQPYRDVVDARASAAPHP